jgi:hypothetical protein
MAFRTGTRVDPRLMEIDYSPSIRASEIMGATIGDVGSTIGKAITTKAEREKEKKAALSYIDVIETNFITEDKPSHPWAKLGERPQSKIDPATGLPLKVTSDMLSNLRGRVEAGDISLATVMSLANVVLEQQNIRNRQRTSEAAATLAHERRRSLQQMGIDAQIKASEKTPTEIAADEADLAVQELNVEKLRTANANQEKWTTVRGAVDRQWASKEDGWKGNTGFEGAYLAWDSFKDLMSNRKSGEILEWRNPVDGETHIIDTIEKRDTIYNKLVTGLEDKTKKLSKASVIDSKLQNDFKSLTGGGIYFEIIDPELDVFGRPIGKEEILYPWSDKGIFKYESEMIWRDPPSPDAFGSGGAYTFPKSKLPSPDEPSATEYMPMVVEEEVNMETPILPQRATGGGAAKPDYSLPPTSFETQGLPRVQSPVRSPVQPSVQPRVQPAVPLEPPVAISPSEVAMRETWAKATSALKVRQKNIAIATDLINLIKEPGLPDAEVLDQLKALPKGHRDRVINSIRLEGVKELLELSPGGDSSGTAIENKKQLRDILGG